jgi:orotate phosphoribosyltransferase
LSEVISQIAEGLYRSGCIKFGTFIIKSGKASPYYIDLARLISSPHQLFNIAKIIADEIRNQKEFNQIKKLASIELKGALILPSIGYHLNLPCVIIRKKDKDYGATGRMTGAKIEKGDKLLFFDDVISEGISKLEGIAPIIEVGGIVSKIMVVVDRQHGGKDKLEKAGFKVCSLTTISEIVKYLLERSRISEIQGKLVLDYVEKL